MDKKTAGIILALNSQMFPTLTKNQDKATLNNLIDVWADLFARYDNDTVLAAFKIALAKAEYPVVPANIFKVLSEKEKATQPTVHELYNISCKAANAIDRCYHEDIGWTDARKANEIFAELPSVLREYFHSPLGLIRWLNKPDDSYGYHQFEEAIEDRINQREVLGLAWGESHNNILDQLKEKPSMSRHVYSDDELKSLSVSMDDVDLG